MAACLYKPIIISDSFQKLSLRTIWKALGVSMWSSLEMGERDVYWVRRVCRHGWQWKSSPELDTLPYTLKLCTDNTKDLCYDLCYAYHDTKQHSRVHCCVFVFLITYSPYSCSMVVKFSVRELSEVKRVSSPHLRLLGFKPLDCLKDYHNLRPSTFIYPSDEVVTLPFMLLESHHYLVVVWTGSTQPYP